MFGNLPRIMGIMDWKFTADHKIKQWKTAKFSENLQSISPKGRRGPKIHKRLGKTSPTPLRFFLKTAKASRSFFIQNRSDNILTRSWSIENSGEIYMLARNAWPDLFSSFVFLSACQQCLIPKVFGVQFWTQQTSRPSKKNTAIQPRIRTEIL